MTTFGRRTVLAGLAAGMMTPLLPGIAQAQSYPTDSLRMIIPFPPGGATGPIAALFSEQLSKHLGQSIVLDHIPGSGGMMGAASAAQAEPDGYNIFFGNFASQVSSPLYNANAPYDPNTDFTPIGRLGMSTYLIVLHESVPANTVPELAELMKTDPNAVMLGSAGVGSGSHIAGEMFAEALGTKFTHVPYKGSAPHIVDFIAGRVQLGFTPATIVEQHLKSGVLKAIAVASPERLDILPDIPTFEEQMGKPFVAGGWYGLFGPAGMSDEHVAVLSEATEAALEEPELRERLTQMGVTVNHAEPDVFATFIAEDIERMRPILQRLSSEN